MGEFGDWLQAGSTMLAVGAAYWLTSRAEKQKVKEHKDRVAAAEPNLRAQFARLVELSKHPTEFAHVRKLKSHIANTLDYAHLSIDEVHKYSDFDHFNQFTDLKSSIEQFSQSVDAQADALVKSGGMNVAVSVQNRILKSAELGQTLLLEYKNIWKIT